MRHLDVASLVSVRDFAQQWEAGGRALHILVNNAGVYAMGAPRTETPQDGLEIHMATNHLGPFLLTLMLLPSLRRGAQGTKSCQGPGSDAPAGPRDGLQGALEDRTPACSGFGARIVNVSSNLHLAATGGIDRDNPLLTKGWYLSEQAYGQSKLAQILFTRELRRRLPQSSGITAVALHPGMVLTEVVRSLPVALQKLYRLVFNTILLNPEQGARASVYCATSPDVPRLAATSEGYFGADCRPVLPGPHARDDSLSQWLWDWSAEVVKLPKEADI